ncbi:MAG: protease modulator HflC [Alteraurantiacibacter sp.]
MWQTYRTTIIAAIAALVVLASTVVNVGETQQAVVIRTGEPVRVFNQFRPDEPFGSTGAGINFRIPLLESVRFVDRRVLALDLERREVLANDQQRLQVDAYARYRIIDPVKMVRTSGSEAQLETSLQQIMNSTLRQELGRRTFASLLTPERGAVMTQITENFDQQARRYGVQVLDVRIKRADLPQGTLQAAFTRMESNRLATAATIRAAGERDARIISATAQARAAQIYAEAFNKDPQFYDFYRAMQSYRTTFAPGGATQSSIILSPDNDYLRQFRGG